MTLVCSNPDCDSHEDGNFEFNITCTVGPDRKLSENLNMIGPAYFTCVYCNSQADEAIAKAKGGA